MADAKPTVLMLLMSLDIGGAETSVISLAKGMQNLGWNVFVASHGGQRVQDLQKAGIKHFYAPLHSRNPLNMARAYRIVSTIVEKREIDIIHAHARIPIWIAEKVSVKTNVPLVTTYHGTFKAGFPWAFFSRQGDKTIAVSETINEYIVEKFNFIRDKITVIPNGIDTDLFRPISKQHCVDIRNRLGIAQNKNPLLLYMSRLDDNLADAAVVAMDATSKLSKRCPNAMLLIAGDGKRFASVKTRAKQINSQHDNDIIRCLGFVLDTPSLYAVSDIVIGMSRVALEAMATAKPVIIFGPLGIFGPVSPLNVNALEQRNYVSLDAPYPPSPEILHKFINDLIQKPKKREKLGHFGRRVIVTNHSEQSVAKTTEKIYCELLVKK